MNIIALIVRWWLPKVGKKLKLDPHALCLLSIFAALNLIMDNLTQSSMRKRVKGVKSAALDLRSEYLLFLQIVG